MPETIANPDTDGYEFAQDEDGNLYFRGFLEARAALVEAATEMDGIDIVLLSDLHEAQQTGLGEYIDSITLLPGRPIGPPPTTDTNNIFDINFDDFWLV